MRGRTLLDILQKIRIRRTLRQVVLPTVAAVQSIRGVMEAGVTQLVVEVTRTVGALDPAAIILRVEVIHTAGRVEASPLVMKQGTMSAHPLILRILLGGPHRRAKIIQVRLCRHRRHLKDLYQSPSTS